MYKYLRSKLYIQQYLFMSLQIRMTKVNKYRSYNEQKKQNSYEGMSCKVAHGQQLSESFQVQTGVRQGCLLSPFLFLLAIDWIMKETISQERNGIRWTLMDPNTQLDDLDFADNLALLSSASQKMQAKTDILAEISTQIGLHVNTGKTKVMRVSNQSQEPISLYGEPLSEVDLFIYLGSIRINQEGQMQTSRLEKVRPDPLLR